MKFNKNVKEDIKEVKKLMSIKDKDVKKYNIDTREKRVNIMQYVALLMLIIGCIMTIFGAKFMDTIFKSYNTITKSTLYNGIIHRDKENDTLKDTQQLMNEIENLYESSYSLDIKREEIDEYVLNALVSAYGDKYAVYRDPSETIQNYNKLNSHISGIGILCRAEFYTETEDDKMDAYIIDVYDGSPAEKAGIEVGDKITKVNGKELSASKYSFSEVNNDIRGDIGTEVEITFEDASNNYSEKTVKIIRKNTSVNTVRYRYVADDIGYIVIRGFEIDTSKQFEEAINYFTSHGVNKFIFDLRDNGGGIAETCVHMLDLLLPEGLIINQYDNKGNIIETSMSDKDCVDFESICLTNIATASASEMFIQSLKDYGLTKTIGSNTYGKGTVCTTFSLSNGGTLTMSTGNYLTKSNTIIEGIGIKPDIELKLNEQKQKISYKLTDEEDDLIQRAILELHN